MQRSVATTVCSPPPFASCLELSLRQTLDFLQWPSKAFLIDKFPGGSWRGDPADAFATMWIGHAQSWETVLAGCDEGVFTSLWPAKPLPLSGLLTSMG